MGSSASRRAVVLIVEDEFLLRVDAVDMIKAAGFDVVEAANADEAIEILESRRDITVVFTDIQMPGSMDGLKLARAVRGRWPPIKNGERQIYAMISGVIWSSMKAMRSRNCSLRFFSRCSRNKSGAGD